MVRKQIQQLAWIVQSDIRRMEAAPNVNFAVPGRTVTGVNLAAKVNTATARILWQILAEIARLVTQGSCLPCIPGEFTDVVGSFLCKLCEKNSFAVERRQHQVFRLCVR